MKTIKELKKVTDKSQGNFITFALMTKAALVAIELHEAGVKSEDIPDDGYSVAGKVEHPKLPGQKELK